MGSSKVQAPPPRDYYKEMSDTIRAQIDLAPKMMEAERRLVPQWQQLQYEQMMGQANNLKTFYRSVMGDSAQLLRDYGSTFADSLAPIAERSRATYDLGLGGGAALQNLMRAQAGEDLGYGTGLTPEMRIQAEQMARGAATARGLTNSAQGIGMETLSGYNLGLQRQDRARTFANQVLGNDVSMSGAAYNQYGAPLVSSGLGALSPMGLAGQATQYNQGLGPTYLQPESQYAANLAASNYNGELQARTATAQNKASMTSGLLSAAGSVVGGMATGGVGFFASAGLANAKARGGN
jgi:hypothetical protein